MRRTINNLGLFILLLFGSCLSYAQPVADFTSDVISGCSPLTVSFTSTSTGNPTDYLWNFGNLNTSTLQNPSAIYVQPGTYTVTLKATAGSQSNTKVKTAYITVYANPVAKFNANPTTGCVPLSVNFTDQTTGTSPITTWTWDFGNGNTGNIQNPSNPYSVPGTYDVTLAVKDANGCDSTLTKVAYITATPGFSADFTSANNIACTAPTTVNFTSSVSTPGSYTYKWNFGNSNTSTAVNPGNPYSSAGTYNVSVEVTSASGCKRTVTKNAFVDIATLQSAFTFTTSSTCAPSTLFLTNTSSPNLNSLTYLWQLNGGNDRTSQNTTYQLTGKTNTVRLIVKNSAGCEDTLIQAVNLADGPKASFTVDNDKFCDVPAVVNFTDNSTGGPTSWAWNFGNSIGATTPNATTTYNNEGTFNARLIVSKGGTCRDTAYVPIIVAKPNVDIRDQNRKSGCVPFNAVFDVTDNSVIKLTTWKWELNGVVVSNNANFSYQINQKGTYIFKLTGTNANGCQYITYDTVKTGTLPSFDFTVDRQTVCYNPGRVALSYIKLGGDSADKIEWVVYNGRTTLRESGSNVVVYIKDTGTFTVQVKASINGCEVVLTKPLFITVVPPIAKYSFKTDTCKTDTVYFLNNTNGTANTYLWNFDDNGATSTQTNPMYAYFVPRIYNVMLVATDTVSGCRDTMVRAVNIIPQPVVKFTPNDTAVCLGSIVTFTSLSVTDTSQKIIEWKWTRSDNTTIITNPVKFTFNAPGVFGMTLTIRDKKSCLYKYTDTAVVKVYDGKPGFTLTPNAGCAPLVVMVKDTSKIENPIVSRKWHFTPTDSLNSATDQLSYPYLQPPANQTAGNTVILTVTDSKGCVFKTSKNIKVTRPIPNYTIVKTKACGVDSFTLTAVSNSSTALSPVSYKWFLPNNTTATQNQLIRTYSGDTTYDVKMVITDGQGCKDSITQQIVVNTKAPKIGFDGVPRVIACYKTQPPPLILFTDTSKPGGSPIVQRDWNLGNSKNTITKIGKDSNKVSTFYIKPGRYPVTLKITDEIGCTDSATIPDFIVAGGPIGSYSFTPNRGCNPVSVDFTSVSPNAAAFVWDHADGNVDTITDFTHRYEYTREGVYYPRLTMLDSTFKCDYGFDIIDSIVVLPLPKPDFGADEHVICKDGFVIFNNQTAPHPYPINDWKWKITPVDSILLRNPGPVPFPNEGKYTISLEAVDANGCYGIIVKDSMITVVYDTIPPAIPLVKRATVQNNEEVLFEYLPNTEFDFGKYIIYSSTSQYDKTDITDTLLLETGLNTLVSPYTYQMVAIDVCRNTSAMSETHETVELKATAATNTVELNWTPYTGFDTSKVYEIWRTSADDNNFTLLTTVSGSTTNYTDTSVLCKQLYYYRIRTVETDSMLAHSWSDTSGATPIYIPVLPTPETIRTTVVSNKYVLLEWHKVSYHRAFTFHIYRSTDSGAAVLYKKIPSTDTTFMDMNVDVQEHSYTYTTYVVDACGGQSAPSNVSRTILLRVKMVGNDILKHDPKLTWNEYTYWSTGIDHYVADFYNEGKQEYETVSYNKAGQLEAQHKYINLIQDDYCYKITAFKAGDTSIISESNIGCVSTEPTLFAPNVFTVNDDNLNDVFYVKGVFIETFNLQIYNRWGQLVFETNDMNKGWNGTYDGKPCKPDVFIFKAEGTGRKGQRTELTGNVTLLR